MPLEKVYSILSSETSNSFKVKLTKIFMRKGNNIGVKYVYPVEWNSPTKKIRGSVQINGEQSIGTLYAQVKIASTGSLLVREDPTGWQK